MNAKKHSGRCRGYYRTTKPPTSALGVVADTGKVRKACRRMSG